MTAVGRTCSRDALKEDWWSVLLSLLLVAMGVLAFRAGIGLQGMVIVPRAWNSLADLLEQLNSDVHWYASLGLGLMVFFTSVAVRLGLHAVRFASGFLVLFTMALGVWALSAWDPLRRIAVEPPIVALLSGVVLGNLFALPPWLREAMRAELYVKTGVVLLGASLPLALLRGMGMIPLVQASTVAVVTFVTIYGIARFLGVERRLGAMLAAGGSAGGMPAVLAVAGAVRAKREDISVATIIVVAWALGMIVLQPVLARAWYLPAGAAGAWIGTSESGDAAGLAAVQVYGEFLRQDGLTGRPDQVLAAYSAVRMVGRDVWLAVWAVALSFWAVLRWEPVEGPAGGLAQAWGRFPKHIIGFVLASILVSWGIDFDTAAWPGLLGPIGVVRDLVFVLGLLSIGASVPLRNLAPAGGNAFIAVATGVMVNLIVGFILVALIFGDYWDSPSR
jgi:uncharacterized membrane protein YadS